MALAILWATTVFAQFSGGNGSKDAPYLISSKADMETLKAVVESGNSCAGIYFLLTKDLKTFNTVTTVIGNYDKPFSGSFDGGGCEIAANIAVVNNYLDYKCYVGIFAYIKNAEIKNLSVSGSITLNGTVTSNDYLDHRVCTGGVCGYMEKSSILHCANLANIHAESIIKAGLSLTSGWQICSGGICGYAGSGNITQCYNSGNVSTKTSTYSAEGGICGYNASIINNCYNRGTIEGLSNTEGGGGICGLNNSRIINSYNAGNIISRNILGGICTNGRTGRTNGSVENCFAANAEISGTNNITRISDGTVTNSYALLSMKCGATSIVGQTSANDRHGQSVELSQLQSRVWIEENLGWDFNTVWKINPGEFPTFRRQTATAIDAISADDLVVSSQYYDLHGQPVAQPQAGQIYIVKEVRQSGQTTARKVIKQ
jgi:hypothetical protein